MKEKNHLFSATGIPSLFLIFGVLMLVILSLLGYGTSRQDLRSSSLSPVSSDNRRRAGNMQSLFLPAPEILPMSEPALTVL